MSLHRASGLVATLLLAPLIASACSGATLPAAGLMVAFSSDMSMPKDVDTLEVTVTQNGVVKFQNDYSVGPTPAQTMPATLMILPPKGQETAPVQVRVVALQSGTPRVLRDAVLVVPTTRVAELRMPVEWLCEGSAANGPPGPAGQKTYVPALCQPGETCKAGSCFPAAVDSSTLPGFDPGSIFGGGTGASGGGGACFDTVGCFANAVLASVDTGACTIPAPSGGNGTNVALLVPQGGPGICGPEGCLIPLDGQSSEGWTENGGTIQLPPAICQKLGSAVTGVVTTTACGAKTASVPTCGPWSSVPPAGGLPADGGVADAGPRLPTGPVVVTKVDLLFMIDNSSSMADKQAYLASAIPDLVTALTASSTFPAVHDMHIGIVSSSLGPRLGDQVTGGGGACLPTATVTVGGATLGNHNDDQAHLLTRSSTFAASPPTETALADAKSGFLAWFPPVTANSGSTVTPGAVAVTTAATLDSDFQGLVAGVHEYGCGIESQLESWYRFLIQPDPYASLALSVTGSSGKATWVGVDSTIIQQRHDFLRPDSLVAIIDLTDENDSEIDVRSLGGQGYLFMSTKFYPPHGTSVCATNPADPACNSCQLATATSDPACGGSATATAYNAPTDWGYDLNLRHVHMKAKYGLDPQFPMTRYVNALTSATVPDRTGEYPTGTSGNAVNYVGNNDCMNPLFAASLPQASDLSANVATQETAADVAALCNLPITTTRPANIVFYSIIGGVPWQLLHFDPTNAQNSLLTASDWVRILGTDPDSYDYTGIDPHMIESYQPRTGATAPTYATAALLPALTGAGGTSAAETEPQAATGPSTGDPYNGREWVTNVGTHIDLDVDRQYACIFPLPAPRDCSNAGGQWTVPANQYACDCSSTGLTPDELSPVCDPSTPTNQLYAKAYPTTRELDLARKLGAQGVVSSICPIDPVDNATGNDPLYGYRPAVQQLVNRVTSVLAYTGP